MVRDKIPEIIKKSNLKPVTHKAGKKEFEQKLIEKLDPVNDDKFDCCGWIRPNDPE